MQGMRPSVLLTNNGVYARIVGHQGLQRTIPVASLRKRRIYVIAYYFVALLLVCLLISRKKKRERQRQGQKQRAKRNKTWMDDIRGSLSLWSEESQFLIILNAPVLRRQ